MPIPNQTQFETNLAHRISLLEAHKEICDDRAKNHDRRTEVLEVYATTSDIRLDNMNNVHVETLATLTKMQATLEQLNVVLVAFNKWENTKSGLKDIGDTLLWISKVGAVVACIWTAVHFTQNRAPDIPLVHPTYISPISPNQK